ncbi:exported hypothetical protein [Gammaproteobacteria bacterium]
MYAIKILLAFFIIAGITPYAFATDDQNGLDPYYDREGHFESTQVFSTNSKTVVVTGGTRMESGTIGGNVVSDPGRWNVMANGPFDCSASNVPRVASYTIKFSSTFNVIPIITSSLTSFDFSNSSNTRVQVLITNITKTGFTLKFATWCDSKWWGGYAQWTAFGK